MLPKYTIEYSAQFGRQSQSYHYSSDDPVPCEEVLAELLERGFRIKLIRHEGLELAKADFDRMIKIAAGVLALAGLKARMILIRYLRLNQSRFWMRLFDMVLATFLGLAFAAYLLGIEE